MPKASVPRKRPSQERGKRTREQLLLAAIDSLVEHNLFGLRYSQIAKAVKVPQPLMDYHFPTLESLVMEMIQHQLEKLRLVSVAAIEDFATKPSKALTAYIKAPFDLAERDKGFRAVWTAFYHLTTVHESFRDFNRDVRRTGFNRFQTLLISILHADKKGKYLSRPKLLNDVALSLQGIVTGYAFMAMTEDKSDFKAWSDLAAKAAAQLLAENFP